MNDHGAGLHPRRVAPRILAAARQPVATVPQRPQRIGAALLDGARITVAHRPGHRVQALVQRVGVGGEQQRLDGRRAAAIGGVMDVDMAAAGVVLAAPQRGGVIAVHPVVDLGLGFRHRQRPPPADARGQRTVDLGPGVAITDQPGPRDHRSHHSIRDRPGGEDLPDPRQVPQLQGDD